MASPTSGTTDLLTGIRRIWEEALDREQVASDTEFSDLGGESMQIIKIIVRIQEEYGADITLSDFLAAPSPRGCATAVAHALAARARE